VRRVEELGAGIGLEDVAGLREAVQRLLDEPSYRSAAERVARAVAQLPPVSEAPAALSEWAYSARAA
jgi:UDP:flavonoid glycosyltransferase YjiC (YdhE family)